MVFCPVDLRNTALPQGEEARFGLEKRKSYSNRMTSQRTGDNGGWHRSPDGGEKTKT